MLKNIFKQDSMILGLVMGIIAPWILFGILFLLNRWLSPIILNVDDILLRKSTMQLIGIVVNVFAMRYYMVKLKYDNTGKGILIITFIYIIAFFAREYLAE